MLSTPEILVLFALAIAALYWVAALRAKELARAAGQQACARAEVQLLDDTVELTRLRLRRTDRGALAWQREYRFEFTRDGATRYRGRIAMAGTRVLAVELEPFRL